MFFLSEINESTKCKQVMRSSMSKNTKTRNSISLTEFQHINENIIQKQNKICDCGCFDSPIMNCEREYSLKDVENSASAIATREISDFMDAELIASKVFTDVACIRNGARSGGYCINAMLEKSEKEGQVRGVVTLPFPGREIKLSRAQIPASELLFESLISFIEREKVKSINDFGASIGQYGTNLRRHFSDISSLLYRGYDEAGTVEIYTQGFISYFDLSIPLKLPVADWVTSFEVGHLMPPHKEGMMIRNLHAHNCKGIILTWGTYGETDLISSNLHDNEYLIELFSKLGYYYDEVESNIFRENWNPETDGMWFHKSLLVLRRHEPIC